MSIIKAENLIFDYITKDEDDKIKEKKRAINNIDLNIESGDFIAILGHNGSGKSTLAKQMNGLLLPSDGVIYISDMNTKEEDKLLEIRKTLGMVFQNPDNQIIGNTVEEDVAFGLENIGVESSEIIKRVDESLDKVCMLEYKNNSPNKLSGGQKQRVAIAGVMSMKPKCIVFDEPTAMLDPIGRAEVIKTALELNKKENITIILITHYMEEVVFADRVIVMDKGSIVMDDTPKNIFANVEKLEEYSLDVPPITRLAYELKKDGMDLPDSILDIDEFVNNIVSLFGSENVNRS